MRIIFAGTPEFAVPSLEALLASGHQVIAVYTQPDRPAGRGQKLHPSPVKKLALAHHLPVIQPKTLRNEEAIEQFIRFSPDLLVVAAYGLILPSEILDAPTLGAINVHASLLPRWRGAAPIQRAILAGDMETGITIMQVVPELDAGPMLIKKSIPITSEDTAGDLHEKLAELGAQAVREVLPLLETESITPRPQDESQVTYADKIRKEEAHLDWSLPAQQLARCVRAFNPWPVAFTYWQDKRLRIWCAEVLDQESPAEPGTVIRAKKQLQVATGEGVLRLLEVQLPGGKRISAEAFLSAHDCSGARFK
ncbi:MAG: methionyl-tRNA formyltransferase [Methylothermaceae bacteria B42]|nr:MAG: methionyl-tRNA formyltransferase [Methylothermaceae bacteria B42]HHJ39377.1 methionyl-tRNA formyltransferase [Methylothermaceae bacterium]